MKKILAIFLATMMVFALAACGDNNTTDPDKDNPGVSQSGENNDSQGGSENQSGEDNSDTSIPDVADIPEEVAKYVGTMDYAYAENANLVRIGLQNADDDAFERLIGYYTLSGTLDEENSTSSEKVYLFDWGSVRATHFGFDEEITIEITIN